MATARARLVSLASGGLRSRLARDSAAALCLRIAWAAIAFLAQVVAARVLGVEGFGVYAYVLAWLNVLPLLATFGLNQTTLRFASAYRANEAWARLNGLERYAERRVLLAGLAIVAAGWSALALLGDGIAPALARSMAIGLLAVPVLALVQLRAALLRALGHIAASMAPADLLRNAFLLGTLALAALAAPGRLEAVHVLSLTLLGALLSLAVLTLVLHRLRPPPLRRAGLAQERAEWRRTALPFLLLAGSQLVLMRTDVLMLGWLVDTTAAGVYTAAVRLAELAVFALAAINMAAAPAIAAAHARGDLAQLQRTATWSARTALAAALAAALPMALLAAAFLALFGAGFTAGTDALRLLLLGQVVNAATGSAWFLLSMTGRERHSALVVGVAAIANALLNAALIPSFGLAGAAFATTATTSAYSITLACIVFRQLAVSSTPVLQLPRALR